MMIMMMSIETGEDPGNKIIIGRIIMMLKMLTMMLILLMIMELIMMITV